MSREDFFRYAMLAMGLYLLPALAWAEENRLALVIGNSHYKESPLVNPQNDANDMAEVLEDLGFEVILRTDADRRDMARAIRDFGRKLKEKRGVGLFYYAGHGMQINNRNFLIPVDTPLEEEDEVPFESIDVGSVLAKMESAGNSLNLLILDACRNNPFPRQFRSSNRGLARVQAPVGSLVVYATAPGDVAADGDGRNGVFTAALLEQLRTDGLSLTQTIRRTRAAVVKATDGRQVPWESSSLMQDYYFRPTPPPEPEPEKQEPVALLNDNEQNIQPEIIFWNSVQAGNTALEYEAYLNRYPDGLFADLARARMLARLASATPDSGSSTGANDTPAAPESAADIKPADPEATDAAVTVAAEAPASPAAPTVATDTAASAGAVEDAPESEASLATGPADATTTDAVTDAASGADQLSTEDAATQTTSIQLARLETPTEPDPSLDDTKKPGQADMGRLTVVTEPADARVRIMNIVEKYTPGITLDRSRSYDVYVTKPGFESFRRTITLDSKEQDLRVELRERDLLVPTTIPLPGGTFSMGCSVGDKLCKAYEKPAHKVSVDPFAITRSEITVRQFAAFVEATGYKTDAEKNAGGTKGCYVWQESGGISRSTARWDWQRGKNWRDPGYPQKSDFPVTCVSWNDANAYAKWLGSKAGKQFSLPTEAEWEYAARAGSTAPYGSGKSAQTLCQTSNVADRTTSPTGSKWSSNIPCTDKYWFSAPVASYKPNAHGIYDMQGNVWEWVVDTWSATFKQTPANGEAYLSGNSNERVLRGGAWDGDESLVRLSSRSRGTTSSRAAMTGFRLVER